MKPLNMEFIREIDAKLLEEDIALFYRPECVVIEWLKVNGYQENFLSQFYRELVIEAKNLYLRKYPKGDFSYPPMFRGAAAIRDMVYPVNIHFGYGEYRLKPLNLIDISEDELDEALRYDPEQAYHAMYNVCDVYDFGYGADDLIIRGSSARDLLTNALSSITAISRVLSDSNSIEGVLQISLVAIELAFKAAFMHMGYEEDFMRNKLKHNFKKMASLLVKERSLDSDQQVIEICESLPDLVNTRYRPSKLTRLQMIDIAMAAQFIAAECTRRITDRNSTAVIAQQTGYPRIYKFQL